MDPLASNKGFWAEVLGVGDFYYELAVQIVEICLATRSENGGLMTLRVGGWVGGKGQSEWRSIGIDGWWMELREIMCILLHAPTRHKLVVVTCASFLQFHAPFGR